MSMANRPEVKTAPAPVVAVDAVVLAQQMLGALARVPFRRPLRGRSNRMSNFGEALTREVVRSFMGYVSSLPVPEFRSIEYMLDELCKVVMPPVVRSFDVSHRSIALAGVPGILYEPRNGAPEGIILYLHGGGYIGTSPTMYAFFTAYLCRETRCAVFVADYRLAPEFPFPAGLEDAALVLAELVENGTPAERLFVAGDSAGGGLAAELVQAAAPERSPGAPGRAHPLLARGRHDPRRALRHRERTSATSCRGTSPPRPTCTARTRTAIGCRPSTPT